MAIIIPSSKTYNRQNPKVRDNVIERIEVGAVEVVPDNDYETPVYNESMVSPSYTEEENHNSKYVSYKYDEEDSAAEYEDYIGVYAGITAKYTNIDISIPKLSNNKLISNLLLKKDNESKIGINLICEVRYYSVTADYDTATNTISNIKRTENEQKRETKNSVNIQEIFSKQNGEKGYLYSSKSEEKYGVQGGSVSVETSIKDNNNISTINYESKNESYEIKGLKILSGATRLGLSGHSGDYDYIYLTGEEVDYTPVEVEITIYGNTIGIDLVDKTVYINGETAKKVHSVEGNELMQTSNYEEKETELVENIDYRIGTSSNVAQTYFYTSVHLYNKYPLDTYVEYTTPSGTTGTAVIKAFATTHSPAIASTGGYVTINRVYSPLTSTTYEYFKQTQQDYAKGKETSVIRCSIGDYFDENGEKKIAIDNSTQKMIFREYDKVIPMVYGADGQDHPMSVVDGKAKVFQVLGTRAYYDGAVWQELSLQECGLLEIKEEEPDIPTVEQLTAPTISLDGDTLTMTATDDKTEEFVIFVDGVETATVANEEELTPTEGLAYELSSDGTYYTCTGMGTATDTDIVIANEIDRIPVTSIASEAFKGASAITVLTIPKNITSISKSAFDDCVNLNTVNYLGTLEQWCNISYDSHVTSNPMCEGDASLYLKGSILTELTVPTAITDIKKFTFCGCGSLTSVTIHDSVNNIGKYAFYGCGNLTNVVIGKNVTNIGEGAFQFCSKLSNITFTGTTEQWGSITLGTNWNASIPATYVQCTDGTVAI